MPNSKDFDLDYRPYSYWGPQDLRTHYGGRIKGELRRAVAVHELDQRLALLQVRRFEFAVRLGQVLVDLASLLDAPGQCLNQLHHITDRDDVVLGQAELGPDHILGRGRALRGRDDRPILERVHLRLDGVVLVLMGQGVKGVVLAHVVAEAFLDHVIQLLGHTGLLVVLQVCGVVRGHLALGVHQGYIGPNSIIGRIRIGARKTCGPITVAGSKVSFDAPSL